MKLKYSDVKLIIKTLHRNGWKKFGKNWGFYFKDYTFNDRRYRHTLRVEQLFTVIGLEQFLDYIDERSMYKLRHWREVNENPSI